MVTPQVPRMLVTAESFEVGPAHGQYNGQSKQRALQYFLAVLRRAGSSADCGLASVLHHFREVDSRIRCSCLARQHHDHRHTHPAVRPGGGRPTLVTQDHLFRLLIPPGAAPLDSAFAELVPLCHWRTQTWHGRLDYSFQAGAVNATPTSCAATTSAGLVWQNDWRTVQWAILSNYWINEWMNEWVNEAMS